MSTLGLFGSNDCVDEFTPLEQIKWENSMGYTQSKWVAEKLLNIASTRGIPSVCFRAGLILGNSQTGVMNTQDQFSIFLRSIIEMGKAPDQIPLLNYISPPVDYIRKAIVTLSLGKESFGNTYHFIYPPIPWVKILSSVQDFGYPMQVINLGEWLNQIDENPVSTDSQPLANLQLLYQNARQEILTLTQKPPQISCQFTLDTLTNNGAIFPSFDIELMHKYLRYLVSVGLLKKN